MNRKGFAPIIILLVVAGVVLAGAVGYFAFVRKPAAVVQIPNSQSTSTPTDETAHWKTYRNEQYGVEFRYPQELVPRESADIGHPDVIVSFPFPGSYDDLTRSNIIEDNSRIDFSLSEESSSSCYGYRAVCGDTLQEHTKATLNNSDFDKSKSCDCGMGHCDEVHTYSIARNNQCVWAHLIIVRPNVADTAADKHVKGELVSVLEKILSTFKFIPLASLKAGEPTSTIDTTATLLSATPTSGVVGTTVTLQGSGFSKQSNTLLFFVGTAGPPGSGSGAILKNLSSPDGKTISFVIPAKIGLCSVDTIPDCNAPDTPTPPGQFSVLFLDNRSAKGVVMITVTKP